MMLLSSILFLAGAIIAHASAPIPYAGKLSVDQINYSGNASFSFEVLDENGTVQWKNGDDRIEVPVSRGRYLVLLGGQGMNPLPTELIHRDISLFLRVRVDLGDGEGVRLLSPDVAISTSPRALAAEIAKLADRATLARSARPGSISLNDFSADLRSSLSSMLAPDSISGFPVDGLIPRFTNDGSSIPVRVGDSLTLTAPSTPGANLNYSWKRNGELIDGANQPSLQITADEAVYTVTVENALGSSEARFSTYGLNNIKPKAFDVHSSAYYIDENNNLWGVGANFYGKIGLEGTDYSYNAVNIAENVIRVVCSDHHALFIKTDASLWGIGRNHRGQLGNGSTGQQMKPVEIVDGKVVHVEVATDHTLFIKIDGSLWGMGSNEFGQLGPNADLAQVEPIKIFETGVSSVSAGEGFSFVLMKDGELRSFGRNDFGQLGDGSLIGRNYSRVVFESNVQAVSCGNFHTVVLLEDGSLWSMGNNEKGQLGIGNFENSTEPVRVIDSGVQAIDAGYHNSYFLKEDGGLWGMGANRDGQLGVLPRESVDARSNISVKIASDVAYFSSGGWSLLYSTGNEKLYGLGYTGLGQFGIAEPIQHSDLQEFNASEVERIEAFANSNGYWKTNGEFWVSGSNGGSNLMLGHDTAKVSSFEKTNFYNPRSFAGGHGHSLLVDQNGSLWAVGDNSWGRLGILNMSETLHPVKIVDQGVKSVVSRGPTFFIMEDGSLWGMGKNHYGQLGIGNYEDQNIPIKIVDENVIQVSTGWELSMFLKKDGSIWTMGSNRLGKLGIGEVGGNNEGSFTNRNLPTRIVEGGIQSIALSSSAGYLLGEDGSLWTFGSKAYGQLGEHKVSDRYFPVRIIESDVVEISAFESHVVFVKSDGSLWGMGRNHYGQLGNDIHEEISYPIKIINSHVKSAKVGSEHTIVLMTDGSLVTFGSDVNGQLATGRIIWTEKSIIIAETLAPKLGE
jgi:alpha-tubulin suppressor-like RCC1 family protein